MAKKLTREQKSELAWVVMSDAVEMVGAQYEDHTLPDALDGLTWADISAQLAVWLRHLPGGHWHIYLPQSEREGE